MRTCKPIAYVLYSPPKSSEWQGHKQIFGYKPTEQSNPSFSLEQLTIPFTDKLMIHIYYPGAMGPWHAWWWGELLLCVCRWQCIQLGTYTTWPFTHINYYIISFFWSHTWPWWNFNSTDRFVMFVVFSHCVIIVVLLICYRLNVMQLHNVEFIRSLFYEEYYLILCQN